LYEFLAENNVTNLIKVGLLAAIIFLAGCDQAGQSSDKVVVINLQEIAEASGQDDLIRTKVEGVSADLTEQLRSLIGSMETQLQAEREKLGTSPAAADVQRIQALTAQAQQQWAEAQSGANNQIAALESQLAGEFRDKVLPLARIEARNRGATVLLAKDAYLFWSDDSADITSAVIAAWDALPDDQKVIGAEDANDAEADAPEAAAAPEGDAASDESAAPPAAEAAAPASE
jgi:Skp family chaperone for outer membrane proteins